MDQVTNFLVDTNVLVYAYDPRDPIKNERARLLLDRLIETGRGILTPQILVEFYNVVTHRLPTPLTHSQAERTITVYARIWRVKEASWWTVLEAVRGVGQHSFSIWDAMIWASAKVHQVPNILTEDCVDGRLVEGVRYINPFAPAFDLERALPSRR